MRLDRLDARLLALLAQEPRMGVMEASRRLGVARGTVQARIDRLERTGVVRGWGPDLDLDAMGYPVTAFVTLEIRQGGGHDPVEQHLALIPEVLEAHTVTGPGTCGAGWWRGQRRLATRPRHRRLPSRNRALGHHDQPEQAHRSPRTPAGQSDHIGDRCRGGRRAVTPVTFCATPRSSTFTTVVGSFQPVKG